MWSVYFFDTYFRFVNTGISFAQNFPSTSSTWTSTVNSNATILNVTNTAHFEYPIGLAILDVQIMRGFGVLNLAIENNVVSYNVNESVSRYNTIVLFLTVWSRSRRLIRFFISWLWASRRLFAEIMPPTSLLRAHIYTPYSLTALSLLNTRSPSLEVRSV